MIEIYEEKSNMNTNPEIPITSKATDSDMNQLRNAVLKSAYYDETNNILKAQNGTELDPKIPGYEKFKQEASSFFKFENITSGSIDVPANSNRAINIGSYHVPDGYEYIGVLPLSGGIADAVQTTFSRYGENNIYAFIKSYYPAQLSFAVACTVIYVKSDYYNQNQVS